jgi:hypothetical protein
MLYNSEDRENYSLLEKGLLWWAGRAKTGILMTNAPFLSARLGVLLSASRRCPELVEKERFAIGGPVVRRQMI